MLFMSVQFISPLSWVGKHPRQRIFQICRNFGTVLLASTVKLNGVYNVLVSRKKEVNNQALIYEFEDDVRVTEKRRETSNWLGAASGYQEL